MPMAVHSPVTWRTTAGTVSSSGLFTAPATAELAVVTASTGNVFATAEVTVQTQVMPLAWYRFEEDSGSVAADYSGNGYDATLSANVGFGAGAMIKGAATGGLSLGGNGYALIGDPAALQITGAITLSAWIKPTSSTGNQAIIEKGYDTSGTRGEIFLRINSGKYEVGSWNGSNNDTSAAMPSGDVGTWSTVASFSANGTYRLLVTVADSTGLTITSQVDVTVAMPSWVDPTSTATWNPLLQTLTLSGVTRIIGDPGTDPLTVIANGPTSILELRTDPTGKIHLGGLQLGNGAAATLYSVSSSTNGGSVLVFGENQHLVRGASVGFDVVARFAE